MKILKESISVIVKKGSYIIFKWYQRNSGPYYNWGVVNKIYSNDQISVWSHNEHLVTIQKDMIEEVVPNLESAIKKEKEYETTTSINESSKYSLREFLKNVLKQEQKHMYSQDDETFGVETDRYRVVKLVLDGIWTLQELIDYMEEYYGDQERHFIDQLKANIINESIDLEIDKLIKFHKGKGRSKAFIDNEVIIKRLSNQIQVEKEKDNPDQDLIDKLRKDLRIPLERRREY